LEPSVKKAPGGRRKRHVLANPDLRYQIGTMSKYAHLYLFDTLADWEPGHAIAELNSGRFLKSPAARVPVRTVGLTTARVRTMGGVTLVPDVTVTEVTAENTAVLLLSGGDTWLEPLHAPMIAKARELLAANAVVAAICGATMGLARGGLLDDRRHTSNDLDALKAMCPTYKGEAHYQQEPAVTDGNLITASGLAPAEFAHQILKKLDVMSPQALAAWLGLYQTREARYFHALMAAIPQQRG
jgi:putative intracellular protease/amidase